MPPDRHYQAGHYRQARSTASARAGVTVRLTSTGASLGVTTICHPSAFTSRRPWDFKVGWMSWFSAKRSVDFHAVGSWAHSTVYATTGPRGRLTWDRASLQASGGRGRQDLGQLRRAITGAITLIEPTTHFGSDLSILHTHGRRSLVLASAAGKVGICLDALRLLVPVDSTRSAPAWTPPCPVMRAGPGQRLHTLGERYARVRAVPGDGIIDWHAIFGVALSASSYA